jgi:2-haloacid dehalogenase
VRQGQPGRIAASRLEDGGAPRGVIAFDIYGTVVDPSGIATQLQPLFGERAGSAARLWREKQLEFTFRRALMRRYADFDACTTQALRYVGMQLGVALSAPDEHALLESYLRLPAFPDVQPGLENLKQAGHRLIALSNGTERSVRQLLHHAGIASYFEAVLSAHEVETFKPDPAVYALLARATGTDLEHAWLISGNPFDVIGAKASGLRSAWVRRDPQRAFDPWEFSPDVIVATLTELGAALQRIGPG